MMDWGFLGPKKIEDACKRSAQNKNIKNVLRNKLGEKYEGEHIIAVTENKDKKWLTAITAEQLEKLEKDVYIGVFNDECELIKYAKLSMGDFKQMVNDAKKNFNEGQGMRKARKGIDQNTIDNSRWIEVEKR